MDWEILIGSMSPSMCTSFLIYNFFTHKGSMLTLHMSLIKFCSRRNISKTVLNSFFWGCAIILWLLWKATLAGPSTVAFYCHYYYLVACFSLTKLDSRPLWVCIAWLCRICLEINQDLQTRVQNWDVKSTKRHCERRTRNSQVTRQPTKCSYSYNSIRKSWTLHSTIESEMVFTAAGELKPTAFIISIF